MAAHQGSEKVINKAITKRYWLAIMLVAALSTLAYLTLQSALSGSEATAYIVNLSGKQRMLSQHIALSAHRLIRIDNTQPLAAKNAIEISMKENISIMRKANNQLSSGKLSDSQSVTLSPEIYQMYFGDLDIVSRVNNYLAVAEEFIESQNIDRKESLLLRIDKHSPNLLHDLNLVVQQYQIEGEQSLKNIEILEFIVWCATLLTLLLEVLFIFKPMSHLVLRTLHAQSKTMENLEAIVKQRTVNLEISNRKLKEIATKDPLTQIKNRLTLESDIEELLKDSILKKQSFTLCIIDVDYFKQVNDLFGHQAGDFVLKELTNTMIANLAHYHQLYRSGGEEFVLLLKDLTPEQSHSALTKLRLAIQDKEFVYEGNSIKITVSMGYYVSILGNLSSKQQILKAADKALYLSKKSGRNQIHQVKIQDTGINTSEKM